MYIEVLPRVPQFNNVGEEKAFGVFNSDSGGNQMSFPSLSKQVGSRLVDDRNIYSVPIPETQVPETQFSLNMAETQVPKTQFHFNGMPETQVPGTQFVDCDMHETEGGVKHDVLNIHNGIDVCVDTIFPMNEEYEETHFNANPDVHDYM